MAFEGRREEHGRQDGGGGRRPIHPEPRQRPIAGNRSTQTFGEPDLDRNGLLDPLLQVGGVVGPHVLPDSHPPFLICPCGLAEPVTRRHEHKGACLSLSRRNRSRTAVEIVIRLALWTHIATEFPAGHAFRNPGRRRRRNHVAVPPGSLRLIARGKIHPGEVSAGAVDQPSDELSELVACRCPACPSPNLPRFDRQHGRRVHCSGDCVATGRCRASVESGLKIEERIAVRSERALQSNRHCGREGRLAVQEVRQGRASHAHAPGSFRDRQAAGQNMLPYVEAGMRRFLWLVVHRIIALWRNRGGNSCVMYRVTLHHSNSAVIY